MNFTIVIYCSCRLIDTDTDPAVPGTPERTPKMARSVYVPSRAAEVVYADASWMEDSFDWDDAIDNAVYALKAKYPSLEKPARDRWIGNEGRVILENKLVSIVVSE